MVPTQNPVGLNLLFQKYLFNVYLYKYLYDIYENQVQ